MVTYKMFNRVVSGYGYFNPTVEIILYDENWNRVEAKQVTSGEASNLPGKWVSPSTVYGNTKGTMGF